MVVSYLASIVIPVYNTENYVKSCYLSAINQTYPNVEVILVNDASTDRSDDIVKQLLVDTNDRIVQYHVLEENTGTAYFLGFFQKNSIWNIALRGK